MDIAKRLTWIIAVVAALVLWSSGAHAASKTADASCEPASAYLPMAPRGNISSPQVLADRVDESLRKDTTGNERIRGANATPNDYLRAVREAGGTVKGVGALPVYLRSLISGAMPSENIRMSRMVYRKREVGGVCLETYTLDIRQGFARKGLPGEQGWFDANTGNLILAGDCTNSPLAPIAPVRAAEPEPQPETEPEECISWHPFPGGATPTKGDHVVFLPDDIEKKVLDRLLPQGYWECPICNQWLRGQRGWVDPDAQGLRRSFKMPAGVKGISLPCGTRAAYCSERWNDEHRADPLPAQTP